MLIDFRLVVLAGLAGVVAVALGVARLRTAQRLRGATPVRDATAGEFVELTGTATPVDGEVEGTLTGVDCLACSYRVRQRILGHNGPWLTIDEGQESRAFHLASDEGSVTVDPETATLRLQPNADWIVRPDERLSSRIRERVGDSHQDRHLVERRLHDEQVTVIGPVQDGDGDEPVVGRPASGASPRLDRWRRRITGRPFVVADGAPDEAAWRVARPGLWLAAIGLALVGGAVWANGALV